MRGELETITMAVARNIWDRSYAIGKPSEAARLVAACVDAMSEGDRSGKTVGTDLSRLWFAVEWLNAGCVTLTTSHKFAAALGATRITDDDVFTDLKLPASAFRIEIPNGILSNDEHQVDYTQVNFCSIGPGMLPTKMAKELPFGPGPMFSLEGEGPMGKDGRRLSCLPVVSTGGPSTLASLLSDVGETDFVMTSAFAAAQHSPDEAEVRQRMVVVARRIAAGLLLTYSSTNDWREFGGHSSARSTRTGGPPQHRNIYIGRPILTDARPAISAYLGGGQSYPPTVQTLVRGHHKRQPMGERGMARKVIWIEPYWRGPEDAPILARPYHIGTRTKEDPHG